MGFGADRGCECVGYQAHDPSGNEQPNLTLNRLVDSVRFVGGLGVVGVFLPQDPGAPDKLAKQGQVAFDYGNYWFKGQTMGIGPVPGQEIQPGPARPHRRRKGQPLLHRQPRAAAGSGPRGLQELRQPRRRLDQSRPPPGRSLREPGQENFDAGTNYFPEAVLMRSMVYRGPYKVRVEEKDMPPIEHPNDAIVRVTAGGDLRIRPAPVPRHDAGHPGGHDLRPRVHRRGGAGRPVGGAAQARGPGDGAVQHLLRVLLLLRPRAVLQLPQRQPQRHRRRRDLRLLAHLRRLRRRPGRVRARAVRRRRARLDPRLDGRRGRRPAHRRPAHRLLRRPAGRHRRRRHRGGVRRRAGGPVRREVGLADGRRPGDRDRPPGVPAGEGADASRTPRRTTSWSTTTLWCT